MVEIESIEPHGQRIARLKKFHSVLMHRLEKHSFARAEAGIGSDADEAAYRAALARGDTEEMARLDAEIQKRMADFDARHPEQDNG